MAQVFLDLDRTLIDPAPGITACAVHALTELGLPAPDPRTLGWVIGPPLIESFARLDAPDPQAALALYRESYSATGLFDAQVYDGIPGALAAIRDAGHRMHLATAKPHVFARRITAHFGLAAYLDAEFGPELDGTRNDKGALLRHALDRLAVDPAHAVMVGDRAFDIAAAHGAGMPAVAVAWGFGTAAELEQADGMCLQPQDLPGTIAGVLGGTPSLPGTAP